MIRVSAVSGAIIAGASEDEIDAIAAHAAKLGLLFEYRAVVRAFGSKLIAHRSNKPYEKSVDRYPGSERVCQVTSHFRDLGSPKHPLI